MTGMGRRERYTRVLALGSVLALIVGACATDPSGSPEVGATTALSSATPEILPPHEIVRVKARNPSLTKRLAADTRDRSKIPATDDLREGEVLRQHGEWTIVRSKDAPPSISRGDAFSSAPMAST